MGILQLEIYKDKVLKGTQRSNAGRRGRIHIFCFLFMSSPFAPLSFVFVCQAVNLVTTVMKIPTYSKSLGYLKNGLMSLLLGREEIFWIGS